MTNTACVLSYVRCKHKWTYTCVHVFVCLWYLYRHLCRSQENKGDHEILPFQKKSKPNYIGDLTPPLLKSPFNDHFHRLKDLHIFHPFGKIYPHIFPQIPFSPTFQWSIFKVSDQAAYPLTTAHKKVKITHFCLFLHSNKTYDHVYSQKSCTM